MSEISLPSVPPKRSISNAAILIIVLIALVVAGSFWLIMKTRQEIPPTPIVLTSTTPSDTPTPTTSLPSIITQIENWQSYTTSSASWDFGGECGMIPEVQDYILKANNGIVKELTLPGGTVLFFTPNYSNWSNEKMLSFAGDDFGYCGVGVPLPLRAYPDKILWEYACDQGGMYEPIQECLDAESAIQQYYSNK